MYGRRGSGSKQRVNGTSPPSKEDIMETLEKFGDKDPLGAGLSVKKDHFDDCSYENIRSDMESSSASHSSSYSAEWDRLFNCQGYHRQLKKLGMNGDLRSSRFRSIIWKLSLECLPENQQDWLHKTREWRVKYTDLKNKVITNPHQTEGSDLSLNNPLSQADESPWNQFFLDNELRLTIKQDVIRTFPEIEFFQKSHIQSLMLNILFCITRKDLHSYKQGMHELLAPLIFVLHCDHQAFLHACEIESINLMPQEERDLCKEMLDPQYLEHDAYAMFCQVMDTVEPWYISKEIYPSSMANSLVNAQPFQRPQDLQPSNVIVNKLTRIQDYILKKYDLELHMHLERLDIAPQIYGIRWVRLLFGREFTMQDLLVIWDAIFADGIGFDLVDYIFVAMLIYLRDVLLTSDYATCLQTLMKYPPVGDVHYFIEKALYLRDPNVYPKPPNYACLVSKQGKNLKGNKNSATQIAEKLKSNSMVSGFATLTRKMNIRNQTQPKKENKKLPKSSSEPMNLLTDTLSSPTQEQPIKHGPNKGSTHSLSQLDWTNQRPDQIEVGQSASASSLAQMESGTVSQSTSSSWTKVDAPDNNSPTKYATLPSQKSKSTKKSTTKDEQIQQLEQQLVYSQARINDMEAMARYCATKMDVHTGKLQDDLLRQPLTNEDEVLLALAGLKQVRDILKGTLKFSKETLDSDELEFTENHYRGDRRKTSHDSQLTNNSQESSPEAISTNQTASYKYQNQATNQKPDYTTMHRKLFYTSSEDHSSDFDSPSPSHEQRFPVGEHSAPGVYHMESYRMKSNSSPTRSPNLYHGINRTHRRTRSAGSRSYSDSEDAAGLLETTEIVNPIGSLSFDWTN